MAIRDNMHGDMQKDIAALKDAALFKKDLDQDNNNYMDANDAFGSGIYDIYGNGCHNLPAGFDYSTTQIITLGEIQIACDGISAAIRKGVDSEWIEIGTRAVG